LIFEILAKNGFDKKTAKNCQKMCMGETFLSDLTKKVKEILSAQGCLILTKNFPYFQRNL